MKKTSTVRVNGNMIFKGHKLTIGLDLGDRWSNYCVLDEAGEVLLEQKLPTTPEAMKRSVPAVWLHASGSGEGTVFHHDNPNANEAVLAGAGPDAQTFALPENSQDVIGRLSFCFHARIRPATRRSDRSMPLMTLLFKRSGRDDKTPSERFHCPEVILESEGGSGRVVGNPEVIRLLPVSPSFGENLGQAGKPLQETGLCYHLPD